MKKLLWFSLAILIAFILYTCGGEQADNGENNGGDRPIDTSHVYIEYALSGLTQAISCTEGDTIAVPCPSESDSVMYVLCVNGTTYVCGEEDDTP